MWVFLSSTSIRPSVSLLHSPMWAATASLSHPLCLMLIPLYASLLSGSVLSPDLTNVFYQIPMPRRSMKYCGVAILFRGVRMYVRSTMGMPGSETALEEISGLRTVCAVKETLLMSCYRTGGGRYMPCTDVIFVFLH